MTPLLGLTLRRSWAVGGPQDAYEPAWGGAGGPGGPLHEPAERAPPGAGELITRRRGTGCYRLVLLAGAGEGAHEGPARCRREATRMPREPVSRPDGCPRGPGELATGTCEVLAGAGKVLPGPTGCRALAPSAFPPSSGPSPFQASPPPSGPSCLLPSSLPVGPRVSGLGSRLALALGPPVRLFPPPCFPSSLGVVKPGGPGRIRTSVGVSRQIYSLLPLSARAPTR
jgi:hypothetical protein